jgi:hypothetical protein
MERFSWESESLLREVMLHSDVILLTWRSWLERDLRSARVVDLSARTRPPLDLRHGSSEA